MVKAIFTTFSTAGTAAAAASKLKEKRRLRDTAQIAAYAKSGRC